MSSKKIIKLEKRRKEIISEILSVDKILKGSYHFVYTKCGKENCHCFKGEGHLHSRITWRENGIPYTSKVPIEYKEQIQTLTASYKKVRKLNKELDELDMKTRKLLDNYIKTVEKRSRKKILFLNPKE